MKNEVESVVVIDRLSSVPDKTEETAIGACLSESVPMLNQKLFM
jgi:hypothetical protein